MYFFDKKTEYLVWKLQESQARGVGMVRFSVLDEVCRIEVAVTGCARVQGTYLVYLVSGDMKSLLGEIVLDKGRGNQFFRGKTGSLGHLAFPYTQVTGIYIDLKTEGSLEQKWLPAAMSEESVYHEQFKKAVTDDNLLKKEEQNAIVVEEVQNTEAAEEEPSIEIYEEVKALKVAEAKVASEEETRAEILEEEAKQVKQENMKEQKKKITEELGEERCPPDKEGFQLHTDKWQQLCVIYPIVHPFGDGRAYLSIEPRDFVILQEKFQPMVQNSFLLHGFYHYKHLLLGRHKQGRNIQYYLGVPGVFYEKEKSAALFYGFESFEGAVMPAAEGSFGYYLKKVQI